MISAKAQKQLSEISTRLKTTERDNRNTQVFFYGLSSEDKSAAIQKLSKENRRKVHKVDLAKIVSKYIGETEKNLQRLFEEAASKNWILFFDEADALFGKRTHVKDAHDKYANLEVSYLLQRIEEYPGLVVIGTNSKRNIDEGFLRRLRYIVNFPRRKG